MLCRATRSEEPPVATQKQRRAGWTKPACRSVRFEEIPNGTVHPDARPCVCAAAPFTTAKGWERPRCPSAGDGDTECGPRAVCHPAETRHAAGRPRKRDAAWKMTATKGHRPWGSVDAKDPERLNPRRRKAQMVAGGWGRGTRELTVQWVWVFVFRAMKMFWNQRWRLHDSVEALNATGRSLENG